MHNKRIWLGITATGGLGLTWLIRRRMARTTAIASFTRFFEKTYEPEKARRLTQLMLSRYAALLAERPLPDKKIKRNHLTRNIIPGLALYQVLLQVHGGDQHTALADVDAAFRAWTLDRFQGPLAPMKILPTPFGLFKVMFFMRMKAFPEEDHVVVENNATRLVLHTKHCFYLDLLTEYGAPELTPSFCKTDEVIAEMFPAGVKFIREHTLARGDNFCDFQYVSG